MKPSSVDIIIPARNAGLYISETIDSLLNQTVDNWHAIIIDDGSSDNTLLQLQSLNDPRIQLLTTSGIGAPGARNLGLRSVRSPYVMFLDADDRLKPNALQRLLDTLSATPTAIVAYGCESLIDASGQYFCAAKSTILTRYPAGNVLEQMLARCFIPTPGAALIHSEVVKKIHGFTVGLPASQDWDLWCRLALEGDFVFIGEPSIIDYRIHSRAMSRNLLPERYNLANKAVFEHPGIVARFATKQLTKLRRLREARNYYNACREALRNKKWQKARRWGSESLKRNPKNIRAITLSLCAFIQWVPAGIQKRLGIQL